jgi:VanZ family protein
VTPRTALFLWAPVLLYVILIFTLSSMSHPPVPSPVPSDLLHYPEYAGLGFLLIRALHGERPGAPGPGMTILAFLLSVVFGASDEIHQAFVPERIPDLSDWARDCAGTAAGIAAWWLLRRFKR